MTAAAAPFPDITADIRAGLPQLRGRLTANAPLGDITWFRVGGPAQVLFSPADEADLTAFLKAYGRSLPIVVIGLGSNLLVRDGGIKGAVIRLGRGFGDIAAGPGHTLRAGAAVSDVKLARAAQDAGIDGLAFYRGIPGSLGGATRMNAGAHGRETKDVLVSVRALDPGGTLHTLTNADMGFTYRHSALPPDWIVTEVTVQGEPGEPDAIARKMAEVAEYRERVQPIKERTGGSTFKNPLPQSAWKLIDAAGCRGLRVGGASVSSLHCNFLINDQNAVGEDVETLGETVRRRVFESTGVSLEWEIIRLGQPLPGRPEGEALARLVVPPKFT